MVKFAKFNSVDKCLGGKKIRTKQGGFISCFCLFVYLFMYACEKTE